MKNCIFDNYVMCVFIHSSHPHTQSSSRIKKGATNPITIFIWFPSFFFVTANVLHKNYSPKFLLSSTIDILFSMDTVIASSCVWAVPKTFSKLFVWLFALCSSLIWFWWLTQHVIMIVSTINHKLMHLLYILFDRQSFDGWDERIWKWALWQAEFYTFKSTGIIFNFFC